MNHDTPLRTRIRASVAMAAGAVLLLGVYAHQDRELHRAQARADAAQTRFLEADALYIEEAEGHGSCREQLAAMTLRELPSETAEAVEAVFWPCGRPELPEGYCAQDQGSSE